MAKMEVGSESALELCRRRGLNVLVSSAPYSRLSADPEPEWKYYAARLVVLTREEIEGAVDRGRGEIIDAVLRDVGSEMGVRIHPRRLFILSPFAWDSWDGMWRAMIQMVCQRLPLADIARLRVSAQETYGPVYGVQIDSTAGVNSGG